MPSLRRWIDTDIERLHRAGKGSLAEQFERFSQFYFSGYYGRALHSLSELYALADGYHEPVWRLLIQYYEATSSIYWKGNLSRGLDIATQLIVDSNRFRSRIGVPLLYFQETLLYAWLETDGPGYADQVSEVASSTLPELTQPDLIGRYELIQAQCYHHLGKNQEAHDLYLSASARLDWPDPYHLSLKASALATIGEHAQALEQCHRALAGFGELGLLMDCTETRLKIADLYLKLGANKDALNATEEALSQRVEVDNPAQIGFGLHLMGRAMIGNGLILEGTGCFAVALDTLDGLGWLRAEAEIGLDLLKYQSLLKENDDGLSAPIEDIIKDVRHRVYRLRSDDLQDQLIALIE